MHVEQAQAPHPRPAPGVRVHVLVAHAALLDAHGTEELAIAQAALLDWIGHRRVKRRPGN
jgi:hypothetical protein